MKTRTIFVLALLVILLVLAFNYMVVETELPIR